MQRFNKGTAAAIATAATTVLGSFWNPGVEVLAAVNTLIVTGIVYIVPNK